MTKSRPPTTIGHVPAAPGTKIVFLYTDFMEADPADKKCLVEAHDLPVICWEIRKNNHGHTWARPVTSEIIDEFETFAVVMPDGQIDFTSPIAYEEMFEGKTLQALIEWLDEQTRSEIRKARCMDCGKDLRSSDIWGLEADSPVIQNELWDSIVHTPNGRGMLCKADMEKRLGRPLTAQDVKKRPPSHA